MSSEHPNIVDGSFGKTQLLQAVDWFAFVDVHLNTSFAPISSR
jgi:hypothetical protein